MTLPNLLHLAVTGTASSDRVSDRPGRNPESATVPEPASEGRAPETPAGRARRGALVSSTGSSVKT